MSAPRTSVILPLYNGERYLVEQLASILAQDDGDFELLAQDDGSTDQSVALLEAAAARDTRVRLLPSTGNEGQTNRLHALLSEARGEFVAVADQDDVWAADRNRLLLAAVGDGAMAMGRSELIAGDGSRVGTDLLAKFGRTLTSDVRLRALVQPMFSGHATMTRRAAINPAAFFQPLTFDWMMALDAIFGAGFAYVPGAVVLHRIHGGNQLNNVDVAGERRRLSSPFLRELLLSRRSARVHLWLVLSYLGRSPMVSPSDRQLFGRLAGRCYTGWFSHWRPLKPFGSGLRAEFEALRPLAGSPADWIAFAAEVDALCAPTLSPAGLRGTARSWRRGP